MYRRALKNRPQDSELRIQLQQLAERRKEQSFGPSGTASAIAVADIVSPPKPSVRVTSDDRVTGTATTVTTATTATTATATAKTETAKTETAKTETAKTETAGDAVSKGPFESNIKQDADEIPDIAEPLFPSHESAVLMSSVSFETGPFTSTAGRAAANEQSIELTSGKSDGWRKSREHSVRSDDVLIALESPDEHVDLLLDALSYGDSNETKALAATLFGDCDPSNTEVRNALNKHQKSEQAPEVLLAICDSQIERWEADGKTLTVLFSLCSTGSGETQLQAASQLRNFAGTEFESSCLEALHQLLLSVDPNVRATAALTLGDFASLDENSTSRLRSLVKNDLSLNVREAAESALNRQEARPLQAVPSSRQAVQY